MSEDDIRTNAATDPAGGGTASSFGKRLAAAREAAELSVGEMAARLRLHVNQVRALENEDLAQLPEAAYVRGFVRSYARSLGLDPTPLIEDLNTKVGLPPNSVVDGMTRTRDYSPVRAAAKEHASRSLVLWLAVIALIVLGVVGWFATHRSAPEPAALAPAATQAVAAVTAAPAAAAADQAPAAPAVGPGAELPVVVTEPAPAPSQPVADANALLSLSFGGASWVEVIDANGKVLVSQVAQQGDVFKPAGTPPLAVVIGDVSKATVSVRGEPFNLEAVKRANVARFTVK